MLEIKNLTKTYKSKNNTVHALHDIDLKLQDKGMVFILGKSGSGKSTLLNVLGGLDQFDSGEIIICGKSSKDFKQSDFDSYRNTFIGFIFQEYNVMENFTVRENIALALQLQGKTVTDKAINDILMQVDLQNLGDRKPNELSGGQLQRVAIARALIKNPEIIMADEPTGALDSRTGKQVFDTLKKLSQDKLVLIVSHDKEFAKQYADRIIELADGKIISDTSKELVKPETLSKSMTVLDHEFINIKEANSLSNEDIQIIIQELKKHNGEVLISFNQNTNKDIKKANHIDDNGSIEVFHDTTSKHIHVKDYTSHAITFIKSKLPFSSSMKLALSNLKLKPFRLFITIMLSVVSFTLFGLTNTLSQYNKEITTFNSMKDSQINYLSIGKTNKVVYDDIYSYDEQTKLNDDDYKIIQDKYNNTPFIKTFSSHNNGYALDFAIHIANTDKLESSPENIFNTSSFAALSSINDKVIKANKFDLIGHLPTKDNEIVITDFTAQTFKNAGYQMIDKKGKATTYKIQSSKDLISKKINLVMNNQQKAMTITGILDTHIDLSRYQPLSKEHQDEGFSVYFLQNELSQLTSYSYHTLGYVSEDLLQDCIRNYNAYPTSYHGYSLDVHLKDNYYSSSYFYNYNDVNKNNIVDFNNNGNVYLNYQSIKDIRVNDVTIQDYVNQQVMDPTDKQEYINAIKKTVKTYQKQIIDSPYQLSFYSPNENHDNIIDKIAGIYIEDLEQENHTFVLKDTLIEKYHLQKEGYSDYIVAPMSDDDTLKDVISYTYDDGIENTSYTLNNQVMPMLTSVNSVIDTLATVFLVGATGLAIFAAVMFCNFIATSIANKKREIGILRAVGARGLDVLKIFLNESLIIALINWLLATVVCLVGVNYINGYIRNKFNMLVTILNFGPLQIIIIFIISIFVAFIASSLPVFNISRKKPIDAIKNRK